jgi:hypothetical protein
MIWVLIGGIVYRLLDRGLERLPDDCGAYCEGYME